MTFAPTALLVVTHNVTGLKYFCKTTRLDRLAWYKGSGIAWRKHLREHGADVTVDPLGIYTDQDACLSVAKEFSQKNDIVRSSGWANLVEELGKNGASLKGEKNPFYGKTHSPEALQRIKLFKAGNKTNAGRVVSLEHRQKLSDALKGRKNPLISQKLTGNKLSAETKRKLSEANKGVPFSEDRKEKIRQAALRQWAKVREQKALLTNLTPGE
jgi:hypothetical protein